MMGKKTVDNETGCKFSHPKPCMKWVNNGSNKSPPHKGCNEGKNCKEYHPRICPDSLRTRTCPNIPNKDSICKKGYHCKSTVYKPAESREEVKKRETKENNSNDYETGAGAGYGPGAGEGARYTNSGAGYGPKNNTNVWEQRSNSTSQQSGPFQLAEMIANQVEIAVARAMKKIPPLLPKPPDPREKEVHHQEFSHQEFSHQELPHQEFPTLRPDMSLREVWEIMMRK